MSDDSSYLILLHATQRVKTDKATLDPLGDQMAGYKGDIKDINARLKVAAKKVCVLLSRTYILIW